MSIGRRKKFGRFYDMGRIRIPPLPQGFVFTDRVDGTLYLLTHSGATYALTSTIPAAWNGRVYASHDGPVLSSPVGLLRLFVSGGTLSYELAPASFAGKNDGRILTRSFTEAGTVLELTAPAGFAFGDALTVTQILP